MTRRYRELRSLSDNMVPRTPRSKWGSLLSRVGVSDNTTTSASVAAVAAADNEVFDDDEVSDKCFVVEQVVTDRCEKNVSATVESQARRRQWSYSDDIVSPCDHETTVLSPGDHETTVLKSL